MPGSLLNADVMFPTFTDGQSSDEKIDAIQSYMFMLVEALRYSFGNVTEDNFTEAGLESLANIITEPIYVQLYGEGGGATSLHVTGEGLFSRIESAEGAISQLQLTADGLYSRIEGIGDEVSTITQTIDGITLHVTNGEKSSTIRILSDGVQIGTEGIISFKGEVVFASELASAGATTINAGNITTGTITAIGIEACDVVGSSIDGGTINGATIEGATFKSVLYAGVPSGEIKMIYRTRYGDYDAGGIRLDDQGAGGVDEARYRMFISTNYAGGVNFCMKLQSAGSMSVESQYGSVFLSAATAVNLTAPKIYLTGDVYVNGEKIS